MRRDHDEPDAARQTDLPFSERLARASHDQHEPWPDDEYVPHDKARGRNPAARAAATGAMLGGGVQHL
ncbi:hypothetical protein GGG17_05940 [Arsenicicoccus sp. MKL-02]|uniref:Uncharacterized protein n=1 Tax=Arsenicicoccus cauae TaxID=2663847 RepID=A0A6I3ICS0_9MICO|nr:hypothetical protein [Arsenicicoccus cauae]MTB71517.1 hypothetical protein [Arsenicicoccus cauae]